MIMSENIFGWYFLDDIFIYEMIMPIWYFAIIGQIVALRIDYFTLDCRWSLSVMSRHELVIVIVTCNLFHKQMICYKWILRCNYNCFFSYKCYSVIFQLFSWITGSLFHICCVTLTLRPLKPSTLHIVARYLSV